MQVIERDTIKKLKVVRIKTDVEYFWKERIKSSSDLFEKPNEMYDSKLLQRWLPKLRFRKQKDGDLQVGEEFYMNGVMKYSGTYNAKGQRHGKGIAYRQNSSTSYICNNNQNDSGDYLALIELCHCNYEDGELHGFLDWFCGDHHRLYLWVHDPNVTPTYHDRDQFRLVQANKLFTREPFRIDDYLADGFLYRSCHQEFYQGEMKGSYKVYNYLRNGQKMQKEAGYRQNGFLQGIYRKWDWQGKLQQIKDIRQYDGTDIVMKDRMQFECHGKANKEQIKITQEQLINEYFPKEYKKLDYGLQSISYETVGQIKNISILKDGDKYQTEIVSFKCKAKLVKKEFTIPKGFHPFLKSGEKVLLVLDSGYCFAVQHSESHLNWMSSFDAGGNLLRQGFQKQTKDRPKWDDYQGQRRCFKSNNLLEDLGVSQRQTESSYVLSRNVYLKKMWHENGKLASKIDTRDGTKTFYNENGSFKEVIYQDNYKVCWENVERSYVRLKGNANKRGELHGKIVFTDIFRYIHPVNLKTCRDFTSELKFYENGIEYPYKALEKLDNMRKKQKAIKFGISWHEDICIVTSFIEFEKSIVTQLCDMQRMIKKKEFVCISVPINEYMTVLRAASETLTELMYAQRRICNMTDVFSVSEQISKDLKKEKMKFKDEEEIFKNNIIQVLQIENNAFQFCSNVDYLKILKESNKNQLIIDNSITKYLQKFRPKYHLAQDAKNEAVIKKIVAEEKKLRLTVKPSDSKVVRSSSISQSKSNLVSTPKNLVSSREKSFTRSKSKLQMDKSPMPNKPSTFFLNLKSPNKTIGGTSKTERQTSQKIKKRPEKARPISPTNKKQKALFNN